MKHNIQTHSRGFDALNLAYELVRRCRLVLETVERKDKNLADQGRRAMQSMVLNLAEGRGRMGRDRVQHWRYAFGSAEELEAVLLTARAMEYVADVELELALLDREHAMLWRLTRR